ncbi:MAG: peptidase [Thermoleophilia bacterium]|nr:peptidase [Thermoleophilia bacterium]
MVVLAALGAPTIASATSPAHGIRGLRAVAAETVIEAAEARGVSDLGASAFTRATPCGTAGFRLSRATAAQRAATRELVRLRAQRPSAARTKRIRTAAARLVRQRVAVRAAAKARAAACTTTRTARRSIEDEGSVTTKITSERPASVVSGRGMAIALPIDFRDVAARRTDHTPARYEQMLFGRDYRHGGGSLARFYSDMSFGAFTVDGDVAPWRRVAGTRSSYAGNAGGMGSFPNNSQSLLEDAVQLNDASIDFGRYDNDGRDGRPNSGDDDGYVDAVFLVYAGTSAAEDGNLDLLWPHAWRHVVTTGDRSRNGGMIRVGRYAAVPERMPSAGSDGDLLTVGVVAHEFGHILGLPDLVDGSDDAAHGAGRWDLMGSGLWGFRDSARPTGLSAWSRARLGWITPQLVQGDDLGHELGSSYGARTAVRLPIDGTPLHESFLVERRTRTGFDADLPGEGLLVWHIDDSVTAGADGAHPRVALVAADGRSDGGAGDLLAPGDNLSDSTTPSLNAWAGTSSLVAVQNVRATSVDLHAGEASRAPIIDAAIDDAGPRAAAPTVTLDAPAAGARLRGTVTIQCTGMGSPNVNRVSFLRDASTLLSNVNVAPSAGITTKTYAWGSATGGDGAHTLDCTSRNTASQVSAPSSINVTVDNTLPATPTISAPAAGSWVRGTVAFTVSGTDAPYGVTSFSHRVDGVDDWQGPWAEVSPASNTYNWDTTLAANGAHALSVRSMDLAGNTSATSANRTVNVDNAIPTMPVPMDATVAPDLDFQLSTTTLNGRWVAATDTGGSGLSAYSWRFCTSVTCSTVLASGSGAGLSASATGLTLSNGATYFVCVRASDVAGNQSTETCSDGIAVDTAAPTVSTPADGTVAPDLDFQSSTTTLNANWIAANDGTGSGTTAYDWRFCPTVACATVLASGTGAGLAATASALTLTNGTTYFACVRARDALANVSAYSCSDGTKVDTTAPTMATPTDGATAPDRAWQASTTTLDATWTAAGDGTGSGVASYDWRFCPTVACATILASGTSASPGAAAGSLALANASTYFACVRARDGVNNVSAYVCSNGITVDTVLPPMSAPTDGATLPDLDYQTSTTALTARWTAGADGASGVAGYDWRFCTTAGCGTVLASGSGAGLSATAGSLSLADGATYFACVRVTDTAGNASAYGCSDGILVDTGPPTMPTPLDASVAPDLDFQLSTTTLAAVWTAATDGSGIASYDWRFCPTPACGTVLASGSGAGLSASAGSLSLTDGSTYVACVRATDNAANTSAFACSDGITVDTAAPAMSTPLDASVAPDLDFQASTSGLEAVWTAASDGSGSGTASYDWRFCPTPTCATVLASGSGAGTAASATGLTLTGGTVYYACVRAADALNNTSAYACSDGIAVDAAAPTMAAPTDGATLPDQDTQGSTSALDAAWTAASDGAGSGVAGYDWRFCTSAACTTILASGSGAGLTASATGLTLTAGSTYFACVRPVDNVGNQGAFACSDGVLVDDQPPVMSTPTDGATLPDVDFQLSATTLTSAWPAAIDAGGIASYDWRYCTTPACGTVLASGSGAGLTATAGSLSLANGASYYVCVRATDTSANTSAYSCSDGVAVDTAAPTVAAPIDGATAPDLTVQSSTTSLAASWTTGSDGAGSGIASYDWRFCVTSSACGTVVASGSSAGLSASAGSLALTVGTTYVGCIRAVDALGTAGTWACSNGVLVDIAPTMSTPADGAAADIDAQASTSALTANWAAATDNGTIAGYAWRFCTSPACTTIVGSGTAGGLTASLTGQTLVAGATYFACVRATDNVGNQSPYVCSDGVLVDTTAPATSHGGISGTVAGVVSLTSTSSDAGGLDRVEYRIDAVTRATAPAGGATSFTDPGTAFNTSSLLDGNHAFRVATFDLAGNTVLSGPSTAFIVNNTVESNLPSGSVTAPAAASALPASNVTLSANVSDDNVIVSIQWLLDGSAIPGVAIDQPPAGYAGGVRTRTWASTAGVSSGAHTISARITDASGNITVTPGVSVTKP